MRLASTRTKEGDVEVMWLDRELQHPTSAHFLRYPLQGSDSWRQQWSRKLTNVCGYLWSCEFPSLEPNQGLVCQKPQDADGIPIIFPIPPHWGVLLSLEVEGIWSLPTDADDTACCHGFCRWGYHSRACRGLMRHSRLHATLQRKISTMMWMRTWGPTYRTISNCKTCV